MTEKELTDAGWVPKLCKIGTLYFNDKDGLFCSFINEDTIDVRSYANDMVSLGTAKTFNDINSIYKNLLKAEIEFLKIKLNKLTEEYNKL